MDESYRSSARCAPSRPKKSCGTARRAWRSACQRPDGKQQVWLVATEPYLLDLGGRLGVAVAAAVGLATWVVTVLVADALRRAGRAGPAETLLRRLAYGRRPA